MLDILDTHLSQATTPELKDSLERAHRLFERIELPDYESAFEELLELDGDADACATVQAVVELTRELQGKILAQHLVTLSEDSALDLRSDCIEGLLLLPDYENYQHVLMSLALDIPAEEKFAELLQLVSPHNAQEWLAVIESVSQTLLDRLQEAVQPRVRDERGSGLLNGQMRSARIDALVKLSKIIKGYKPSVVELINTGSDLGYPFLTYARELQATLQALSPENAGAELVAICLVSSDGFDSPLTLIKQHLETLIGNEDSITKILVRVSQIVLALQQGAAVTKVPL